MKLDEKEKKHKSINFNAMMDVKKETQVSLIINNLSPRKMGNNLIMLSTGWIKDKILLP